MTTDTAAANGSQPQPDGTAVAELVATEVAPGQEQPAEPGQVTYADVSPPERAALRPIIPGHLSTWAGIKTEVRLHAHRTAHRTGYHGLRAPWYVFKTAWYSLAGTGYLLGRIVAWWHWLDGKILESQAVAAGRPGHNDAMKAHQQGLKTRKARGQVLAVCVVLAAGAGLAMAVFFPWWGWAAFGTVAALVLARYGAPEDKPIIRAAIISPQYSVPTPQVITEALRSLSIQAITSTLKDGGRIDFISDVHRDGPGWACQLDLPRGVTASNIISKREELASGLRRPLSATWPSEVPEVHTGRLDLWIGFTDMAKAKPAAWPLLKAGTTDVFTSNPFGTDPRGRTVNVPLFEVNWLVGASPGQGKTASVRVLACIAALDPLCGLWIHELAGKGDLDLSRVCHRYTSGIDDESITYAAESAALLRREVDRRAAQFKKVKALGLMPDGKVTREVAQKYPQLRPLVAIFDEVQNLFMHPKLGREAAADLAYAIRVGRAMGVIVVLSTQRPNKESVPSDVSGIIVSRFCLMVPGQVENDMVLGTSSYQNGYKATLLRPKVDAGLGWLKGSEDGIPQIVKTYYLNLKATERIVERARAMRQQAGTLSGYALGEDDDTESRSFLADVLTVFGTDRNLWCETVAERLKATGAYPAITQEAVASQLRAKGVEVKPVRERGTGTRAGCERSTVEQAAGVMAGA